MRTFATFVAYLVLVTAGLAGGVSLLVFVVFLFIGPFKLMNLGLGSAAAVAWDSLLCLAFFIQHSGMIRKSVRRHLVKIIPPHYQSACYAIASGVVLLSLVVFWQASAYTLVDIQGPFRWLLRGVFFLSMAGFFWGTQSLGTFDAFGLKPILAHMGGTREPSMPFVIRGPYRWVRHPVYFFTLILIWSCPTLSADRLLFNGFWTAWMWVGTILEERDLVAHFGAAYRDYQAKVPMLIPWRIPKI